MTSNQLSVSRTARGCPVCGSLLSKHLFHQAFEKFSGGDLLDGYDLVICRDCGMGFADRIPEQSVFDAYYRDLSKYEYAYREGKESEADEARFRDIVVNIRDFINPVNSHVLEIGCATGRLLSLLRGEGFTNIEGLDPSPGCARAAWSLYQIPVLTGSLFDVPPPSTPYDFVILIGVLEHVKDLKRALERMRAVLAPGGRVYAEVPDGSRLAGRPDAPYQEFSVEHINFFSTVSLSNLFNVTGFQTISTGEAVRQQNENTTCPAAFGVYQKVELTVPPLARDVVTECGLMQYIEESGSVDARIRKIIEQGAQGRQLLVWGTGAHTQRLLATGAFANVRIAAFIDSNPKYQGRELHDVPILSPQDIGRRSEPILISTRGFQREIRDQIRNQLNLSNEVICLYTDDGNSGEKQA